MHSIRLEEMRHRETASKLFYFGDIKKYPSEIQSIIRIPYTLKDASYTIKDTKWFVEILLRCAPYTIQFASERLRNNPKLALIICKDTPWHLEHVSDTLRNHRIFMRKAIALNANAYIYSLDKIKADVDIALTVVSIDGDLLKPVPYDIRDNTICEAAVKQNYTALEHVPDNLKKFKIIFMAISQCSTAIYYAPSEFKKKYNIIFSTMGYDYRYRYKQPRTLDFIRDMCIARRAARSLLFYSYPRNHSLHNSVLLKLNDHGYHFAVLFKQRIFSFIGIQNIDEWKLSDRVENPDGYYWMCIRYLTQ